MKVLIDVQHPAHVHFFKNTIWKLEEDGHEVKITAKDKEITLRLLDSLDLKYEVIGRSRKNLAGKFAEMLNVDRKFLKLIRTFKPDLMTGIHHESIAQTGFITRTPSIIFTDTEGVTLGDLATFPFASAICTPACFLKDLGKKHVRFNGYKELAYLHPNYFKPDSSVLDGLNLSKDDPFIVLRFISWAASHDIGLKGISRSDESEFVKRLEEYGQVFITSERKLTPELEKYRLACSPEDIHSLLYYSQLYIGEGGTMATEAAILGTPSVLIEARSSGVASGNYYGNFVELKGSYDLVHFYATQEEALEDALSILREKNSKMKWRQRRDKLLATKIDVSRWMTDFIERYPQSFYELQSIK